MTTTKLSLIVCLALAIIGNYVAYASDTKTPGQSTAPSKTASVKRFAKNLGKGEEAQRAIAQAAPSGVATASQPSKIGWLGRRPRYETCSKNEECLSDICSENKCARGTKKRGARCNHMDECESEKCTHSGPYAITVCD